MSIGKRLEELITYRHTNVNRVARKAGISPQTIYGIIKRDNTKVDINILLALAKELDVTLDFFSGGPLTKEDLEIETFISRYRGLDAHGKKIVKELINLELERVEDEKERAISDPKS